MFTKKFKQPAFVESVTVYKSSLDGKRIHLFGSHHDLLGLRDALAAKKHSAIIEESHVWNGPFGTPNMEPFLNEIAKMEKKPDAIIIIEPHLATMQEHYGMQAFLPFVQTMHAAYPEMKIIVSDRDSSLANQKELEAHGANLVSDDHAKVASSKLVSELVNAFTSKTTILYPA